MRHAFYPFLPLIWIAMWMPTADATAQTQSPESAGRVSAPLPSRDGRHDFDFLHGTWRIHNRRLRRPLAASTEWYEFEGSSVERPVWDGQANLEEYEAVLPDGTRLRGLALRLYEPKTRRWTIHWSSSARGALDPVMTGTFRDGVGVFYSHEEYAGRMIMVRFHWRSLGPDAARWEQAFSADGGESWETNWIMDFTRTGDGDWQTGPCCDVVELRRYTLHRGQRERLIELFEREFVETQEAAGIRLIAQFRDLDDPDAFTWLRGFPNMDARAAALQAFYDGPAWARHRDAANATMISSDDVRLLRPVSAATDFRLGVRGAAGAMPPAGLVVVTIYTLRSPAEAGFREFFRTTVLPRLEGAGAPPFAMFETEPSENTFPRLPVREGEHAFAWFARFDDSAAYGEHVAALARDSAWRERVGPELKKWLATEPDVWRLSPTSRSRPLLVHGASAR